MSSRSDGFGSADAAEASRPDAPATSVLNDANKSVPVRVGALFALVCVVLIVLVLYLRDQLPHDAQPSPAKSDPGPSVSPHTKPSADLGTGLATLPEETAMPVSATAPCDGCLDERAARDIAEAYLITIDPNYLNDGLQLQLSPDEIRRPLAPHEFEGMPPGYSVADHLDPVGWSENEHNWLVWFQVGWHPRRAIEDSIEIGELPLVALSWPPLKRHSFIYVNARTGTVWPVGIVSDVLPIEPLPPTDLADDAATRRATR